MENNISYLESKGGEPINWHERLQRTRYEQWMIEDMCADAAGWVTCAVGAQCSIIPRSDKGAPLDEELNNLGMDFCDAIHEIMECVDADDDFSSEQDRALNILDKIEKRSQFLINQIKSNEHKH